MPPEFSEVQCGEQEWVQIDVADGYFSVERLRIRKPQRNAAGDGAFAHGGVELEFRELAVGLQISAKAADDFRADLQIDNAEGTIGKGRADRSAGFQVERQL